jgi:hypothetical protein
MTQKTLYMVGAVGYEYNDEIYYRGENDAVTPVMLYTSLEKAEAEAVRLTLSDLRTTELNQYAWCIEDIILDTKAHKRAVEDLMEKYSPGWEVKAYEGYEEMESMGGIIQQMSDSDLSELLSHLTIKFYEVHEVELAE